MTAAPVTLAPSSPVAPLPDPFAERHAGSSAADRAARVEWIVNTVAEHFRNPKTSTLTEAEIRELREEQGWLQSHPQP
ncbi:MAG: hypothetical protein NTY35_15995 [Planctomycetota bacterium]|nr:hypothetical protein [Planctomycetota bacterium]